MRAGRAIAYILLACVLVVVLYVMANGIGLVDSLDFGAGAYYYADIPEFDKLGSSHSDFSDSAVAVVAFFIIWSIIILGLLVLVKKLPKPVYDDEDPEEDEEDQ